MNTPWTPAAEIPDNDRPVLLSVARPTGKPFTVRACYIRRYEIESFDNASECQCEYNEENDMFYIAHGWYELISFWEDWSFIAIDAIPLAWQELPEYEEAQ